MINKLRLFISIFLAITIVSTLLSTAKATEIVKRLKVAVDSLLGEIDIADNVLACFVPDLPKHTINCRL